MINRILDGNAKLVLGGTFAFSLMFSGTSVANVIHGCDVSGEEGTRVVVSEPSVSTRVVSRERFGDSTVYPHFTKRINGDIPVAIEDIKYRPLLIEDHRFQRVNEGSREKPRWVRYYRSTNMDDCSRLYFRLDERTDEYASFFNDRGGMTLEMSDFFTQMSGDLEFYTIDDKEALSGLIGSWVSPVPLRDSEWILKGKDGNYMHLAALVESYKFKIVSLTLEPFEYRGQRLSGLSIGIELESGDRYTAPGYAHALVPWEDRQVVGRGPRVGDSGEVLFNHWGVPDRSWMLPVFESENGRRVVEDVMLRDRLASGGSVNIKSVDGSDLIGHFMRVEYDVSDEEMTGAVINLQGEIQRFLNPGVKFSR